jgi:hypothetical protein
MSVQRTPGCTLPLARVQPASIPRAPEVAAPMRAGGAPFPRRDGAGLYVVPLSDEVRIKIR